MDDRSKLRLSAIDRRAGRGSGRAAIDKDLRALKLRFIAARLFLPADARLRRSLFFLVKKITSGIVFLKENALFRAQLWDAFYNFFDAIP
jgi:hypothetical protein